jgi:predicted Ser/Thr protein kinase
LSYSIFYVPENGTEVAMKFEHRDVALSLLEEEAEIFSSLAGQNGFPYVYLESV